METILKAENISRSFKINDNTTVDALKDINLEVEKISSWYFAADRVRERLRL